MVWAWLFTGVLAVLATTCSKQQQGEQERVWAGARRSAVRAGMRSPHGAVLVGSVVSNSDYRAGWREYVLDVEKVVKRIRVERREDGPSTWSFVPTRFVARKGTGREFVVGEAYLIVVSFGKKEYNSKMPIVEYAEPVSSVGEKEIQEIERLSAAAGAGGALKGPWVTREVCAFRGVVEDQAHRGAHELRKDDWVDPEITQIAVVFPRQYGRPSVSVCKVLRLLKGASSRDEIKVAVTREQRQAVFREGCRLYLVGLGEGPRGRHKLLKAIPVLGTQAVEVRRVEEWLR